MITTVVVAQRAEASAVVGHPAPDQRWPGLTSRLVDLVSLATLASITTTGNADDDFERFLADVDFVEQTDERWTAVLGDGLTETLADLAEDGLEAAAHEWAITEELAHWPTPPSLGPTVARS